MTHVTGVLPCTTCGQYFCNGHWQAQPFTFSYSPRLHPDDIEAIAQRVAELMRAK